MQTSDFSSTAQQENKSLGNTGKAQHQLSASKRTMMHQLCKKEIYDEDSFSVTLSDLPTQREARMEAKEQRPRCFVPTIKLDLFAVKPDAGSKVPTMQNTNMTTPMLTITTQQTPVKSPQVQKFKNFSNLYKTIKFNKPLECKVVSATKQIGYQRTKQNN